MAGQGASGQDAVSPDIGNSRALACQDSPGFPSGRHAKKELSGGIGLDRVARVRGVRGLRVGALTPGLPDVV